MQRFYGTVVAVFHTGLSKIATNFNTFENNQSTKEFVKRSQHKRHLFCEIQIMISEEIKTTKYFFTQFRHHMYLEYVV